MTYRHYGYIVPLLGALMLAGCASPSVYQPVILSAEEEAAFLESLEASYKTIEPGQTLQAELQTFSTGMYRFQAEPGTTVTITARSEHANLSMTLFGEQDLLNPTNNQVIAQDIARNTRFSQHFDPNGLNAEIISTLPATSDNIYTISVHSQYDLASNSTQTGPYSISLRTGSVPAQDILQIPQPIMGNQGKYMSPFTEDDTVAPWVEKGMSVVIGSNVASTLSGVAAASAGSNSLVGAGAGLVGAVIGQEVMLQAIGGWEFIQSNSDLSFNSLEDMAINLHYQHASHPQYEQVLSATYAVYPELRGHIQKLALY